MATIVSRRSVLVGLVLSGPAFGWTLAWAADDRTAQRVGLGTRIAFDPDGTLVVLSGKAEMGQGVNSGFAQIIADELGADWARVRAESGPVHPDFRPPGGGEQITGGSMSIRLHYTALRIAGAAAREMLVAEAADRWGVPAGDCDTRGHAVVHLPTGRRLDFAAVCQAAALRPIPAAPSLRPASALTLTGQALPRVDLAARLDGSAVFGVDVRRPGQVFASIRHAPVKGSRVVAFDASALADRGGIVAAVDLGDAVAVVADTWWRAETALRELAITWSSTPDDGVSTAEIDARLQAGLDRPDLPVAVATGDWPARVSARTRPVTLSCTAPMLPHATMEPMSCTAEMTGDGCTVWAPTQGQDVARRAAAQAAGLPETAVTLQTTLMGGAFGRRYEWDFVTQTVRLARAVRRPVTLIWPREEDIAHDFFRPPAAARLSGLIGPDGTLAHLDAVVAAPSANLHAWPAAVVDGLDKGALDGILDQPYAIPAFRLRYALTPVHVNVGFWRSVAYSTNIPFVEAFIEAAAEAAGRDPVAFRLAHLGGDPRGRHVLSRCAALARSHVAGRSGVVVGYGFGRPMLTPAAAAVIARRTDDGLSVERIVTVVDCGRVINPDTVRAQAEGGALFGYLAALSHRIEIAAGRVVQSNFHDVPLLTVSGTPPVTVDVVASDADPTGIGEPTTPVTMAALQNAASQAFGRRITSFPVAAA